MGQPNTPRVVKTATAEDIEEALEGFTPGLEPRVEALEEPEKVTVQAANGNELLLDVKNEAGNTLAEIRTADNGTTSELVLRSSQGNHSVIVNCFPTGSNITVAGTQGDYAQIMVAGGLQIDFFGSQGPVLKIRDDGLQIPGPGGTWYRLVTDGFNLQVEQVN